jgi:hypothetical protein
VIDRSVVLPCGQAAAFSLFTERASDWWPPSRRHTGDSESAVLLTAGGRFWERATDGREVELGRVLEWEAPARLVLDFFPGTDPAHPTRVVVTFEPVDDGTLVRVQHGPTPVSEGALWLERSPAFERSWAAVLAALHDAAVAEA